MSQKTAEDAATSAPAVAAEVVATIEAHVRATNELWASGRLAGDSVLRDVAEDLVAVQYSPRFEGGAWRATSGADWLAGTTEAAEALAGQGCRWAVHDLVVRVRNRDEALAAYRIVHSWGDGRPSAEALFLEAWARGPHGRWTLVRHTAEKL